MHRAPHAAQLLQKAKDSKKKHTLLNQIQTAHHTHCQTVLDHVPPQPTNSSTILCLCFCSPLLSKFHLLDYVLYRRIGQDVGKSFSCGVILSPGAFTFVESASLSCLASLWTLFHIGCDLRMVPYSEVDVTFPLGIIIWASLHGWAILEVMLLVPRTRAAQLVLSHDPSGSRVSVVCHFGLTLKFLVLYVRVVYPNVYWVVPWALTDIVGHWGSTPRSSCLPGTYSKTFFWESLGSGSLLSTSSTIPLPPLFRGGQLSPMYQSTFQPWWILTTMGEPCFGCNNCGYLKEGFLPSQETSHPPHPFWSLRIIWLFFT